MPVMQASKQLRTLEEHVSCDVCGRTMLKGERPEAYLAPSRERKMVCQLCAQRAQKEGWIRESASPATPVQAPRPSERRRFLRRRRRRESAFGRTEAALPEDGAQGPAAHDEPSPQAPRSSERALQPRDPRHVRAVPTNAQPKIERAIDLFNGSEHPRTVAGIARTLGAPNVSACTSGVSAAKVLLTVAWDLSWYQFSVDLSDTNDPVRLLGRGQELDELPAKVRRWNAHVDDAGRIVIGGDEKTTGEAREESL